MIKKVAVVTGSNKGIGLAIVRGLCKEFDGDVFLTSRDEQRGREAVKVLEGEGLKPKYHQLDITNQKSIDALSSFMRSSYGGIDVLVNNVGIAYKSADATPFGEQAVVTVATNYRATAAACDTLLPIMKAGGRVVNVSSLGGHMSIKKCSEEKQKLFKSDSITRKELDDAMNDFVEKAKLGEHKEAGYSDSAYGMSKVGMTVLTKIFARKFKKDRDDDVVINACCPGWIKTDMGGPKASKTPDQGAVTPLYLALLPQGTEYNGNFFSDKALREW